MSMGQRGWFTGLAGALRDYPVFVQPGLGISPEASLATTNWFALTPGNFFYQAVGPEDLKIGGFRSAQPQMEARIICRVETAPAQQLLRLFLPTIVGHHPRSK